MIFLPKCLLPLARLAASEQARYALTHLKVRELAGGLFRVEATDGKVLGIARGPSCPSAQDLVLAAELPDPEVLTTEALVPAAELRRALQSVHRQGCLGVLLGGSELVLVAGGKVRRCPPGEGRFPDADQVLPKRAALLSFRVDPELFCDLIRAAAQVAQSGHAPGVEILYWAANHPIGVISQGANGLVFDGLIMPLT